MKTLYMNSQVVNPIDFTTALTHLITALQETVDELGGETPEFDTPHIMIDLFITAGDYDS